MNSNPKKRHGLPLFVVLLALVITTATASAVFCDEAPTDPQCQCRAITAADQFGQPVLWKEIPDAIAGSEWFDGKCLGEGKQRISRTVLKVLKPNCNERIVTKEYDEQDAEICKNCQEPKRINSWQPTVCTANGTTVFTRNVLFYQFTSAVTDCEPQQGIEIMEDNQGICKQPAGPAILSISNNAITIALIAIITILAVILVLRVFKKI